MIPILLMTSSCATNYITVHKDLIVPPNCIFEKFTFKEKTDMGLSARQRIKRNQDKCKTRQERIESLISDHNKAH